MTDNEVIKALEQCSNCKSISNCKGCPIGVSECLGDAVVLSYPVFEKALDLINRQKAEIERLEDLNKCSYTSCQQIKI